jgi:collagenase-like PrtC family protease
MENNKAEYQMKYSIGTNFDPRLIDVIGEYDKAKSIKNVFGKLRSDIVGGGRNSMILPNLTKKQLKDYILLCHRNQLKFNYLLNPLCMGNRELQVRSHQKIIKYLGELADIGVDEITVNSPYLCQVIKKQFPHFKITIGLFAYIFNLQHIKYWEELGADELTLHHMINRNLRLLEDFLTYTKRSGIELRLIANNLCLHDCPFQLNHGVGQSHASQKGHSSNGFYLDYNVASCNNKKIQNPVKLISSEWIRPEDVKYFEDICQKTGNHHFSIKLLERTKTTEFLTRVIKAYTSRSYEGNLIEILVWASTKDMTFQRKTIYRKAITGLYNLKALSGFDDVFNLPKIYIDNKKLNGFMEKFVNYNECNRKICDDMGWGEAKKINDDNVSTCSYCRHWAEKSITFDQAELDAWVAKSECFLGSLNESRPFYWTARKANAGCGWKNQVH